MAQPPDPIANAAALPPVSLEMAPLPKSTPNKKSEDPFLVEFASPYDPDNPQDWTKSRKWAITDVLSATGFNRIMVSTIMAPALSTIAHEFHMSSTESAMALSIYLLATAVGPLFIGPLSEVYGRQVVLHVSSIWFLIWNVACGFANSKEMLIASRFLAGFGASSIYALAGGVLGDVWKPEQRGRSLSIYLLIPILGACVGPIIGGFMAARTTWRWMFWATSIFQAVMIIVAMLTFQETYGPLILQRRAQALRKSTGNPQYHMTHELQDKAHSLPRILTKALTRPLRLLLFHPIIQIVAVIEAFNYGILYIVLSTFSTLWTTHYHESVEISGLHYVAVSLGEMAGSLIGGPLMDYLYRRRISKLSQAQAQGDSPSDSLLAGPKPEFRIPLMFPGVLLAELGLIFYGWTAQYTLPWIVVDIALFISMFGGQIWGMACTAYIIDAYPGHTSSAMAAAQFVSSLAAFLFPLFAPSLYRGLGYGWGNTALGVTGVVLGIWPMLWVWRFGEGMRKRARSSH